jgi:hypothetical protein
VQAGPWALAASAASLARFWAALCSRMDLAPLKYTPQPPFPLSARWR